MYKIFIHKIVQQYGVVENIRIDNINYLHEFFNRKLKSILINLFFDNIVLDF